MMLGNSGGYLCDAVGDEATLGVVYEPEVLVCLLDIDDIHESRRVGRICAHLAIHPHQPLHENGHHLLARQGIPASIEDISTSSPNFAQLP